MEKGKRASKANGLGVERIDRLNHKSRAMKYEMDGSSDAHMPFIGVVDELMVFWSAATEAEARAFTRR